MRTLSSACAMKRAWLYVTTSALTFIASPHPEEAAPDGAPDARLRRGQRLHRDVVQVAWRMSHEQPSEPERGAAVAAPPEPGGLLPGEGPVVHLPRAAPGAVPPSMLRALPRPRPLAAQHAQHRRQHECQVARHVARVLA